MKNSDKYRVSVENLRKEYNFEQKLDFCSTLQDVPTLEGVIGQDRAIQSMSFGLNMNARGYNIFVLGPQGTGKSTYTQNVVSKLASDKVSSVDWCYINNFDEWDKPFAISLPAGQGRVFQKDMDKLVKSLMVYIPKAYESSDFQKQKDCIIQKLKDEMNSIFKYIEQLASEAGFSVKQAPQKIMLIPRIANRNIEPEEYNKLTDSERAQIDEKRNNLTIEIDEKLREGQMFQKDSSHVNKAIKDRKYRLNMLEGKLQEHIFNEKVLIDTEGAVVGQVNGLAVMGSSGHSFGLPSRITARTYMGREGVINIERETDMSGNIHSKGVLTLNGYLGGKLAQEKPLALTAQVTFEQLYGGVNEKIEGFFDICKTKGLSGEQGVIIPISNVNDLMLKDEVLDAAKENSFHIFAVKSIEEGLELLSDVIAGEITEDGKYPEGSIFFLADRKLQEYNKKLELVFG